MEEQRQAENEHLSDRNEPEPENEHEEHLEHEQEERPRTSPVVDVHTALKVDQVSHM